MSNGKGDARRPMVIDPRQMDFNWTNTFPPNPDQSNNDRIQETTRNKSDGEYGYNRRYSR